MAIRLRANGNVMVKTRHKTRVESEVAFSLTRSHLYTDDTEVVERVSVNTA